MTDETPPLIYLSYVVSTSDGSPVRAAAIEYEGDAATPLPELPAGAGVVVPSGNRVGWVPVYSSMHVYNSYPTSTSGRIHVDPPARPQPNRAARRLAKRQERKRR